jgi:hypothetical protein
MIFDVLPFLLGIAVASIGYGYLGISSWRDGFKDLSVMAWIASAFFAFLFFWSIVKAMSWTSC